MQGEGVDTAHWADCCGPRRAGAPQHHPTSRCTAAAVVVVAGFAGEACEGCADGYYGPTCEACAGAGDKLSGLMNFGNTCTGRGVCNDGIANDGKCICSAGFDGTACENGRCPAGRVLVRAPDGTRLFGGNGPDSTVAVKKECAPCPAGYYCPDMFTQLECTAGHYCPKGSADQIECPADAPKSTYAEPTAAPHVVVGGREQTRECK